MLTQTRLRELYNYDPLTGIFTRRKATCYQDERFVGKACTAKTAGGYVAITVDGERFRACRLAVLYMTGEWPKEHIDHANGNQADDRWSNLREATRSENMRNTKLRVDSSSGLRGVSWNARKQKWHARVHVHGRTHHCGYFNSAIEAAAARDARAIQLHGAFVKLNQLTKGATQ